MTGSSPLGQTFLTVDVEEWFHAPEHRLGRDECAWDGLPRTLPDALPRTLDLLDALGVKATFFVLGWAAARHPALVRRIAGSGHEVGCHGWGHGRVDRSSPEAFRRDLLQGKAAIEEATGQPAKGYRAPRWSMPGAPWPYAILGEAGFLYSSSRLPIPGLGGRRASGPPLPVPEIPALRCPWRGIPLPAGGTVALRVLPLALLRQASRSTSAGGHPSVYWFHPWELLVEGPRLDGPPLFRWTRYAGLAALPGRLAALVPPGDRRLVPFVEAMPRRPS